jgi:hypothetical protein
MSAGYYRALSEARLASNSRILEELYLETVWKALVVAELRYSEISLKGHPYSKSTPLKIPHFSGTDFILDYLNSMQPLFRDHPYPD